MIEKKYVNLNYELKNDKDEQYMLVLEIEEKESLVSVKTATMCVYFEDKLLDMLKEYYPNKQVVLGFKSGIELRYYSYRKFMTQLEK